MSKLKLPDITLLIADGVNAHRAKNVLEKCKSVADFGAVKLLTHLPVDSKHRVEIMPLNSLVAYSIWCLTEMYKHFDTSHCLIVQRDGWIINPQSWNNDWLQYDYIAPLFVQHDDVGSGGFSMRSRRLMEAAADKIGYWDGTEDHAQKLQVEKARSYEDGVISLNMLGMGFNFAPKKEAGSFAAGGNPNKDYYQPHPFGFHGNRQNINHETGFVNPVCVHGGQDCSCMDDNGIELQKMLA